MASPFLGSIALFAGNFAPRGWALCQGQTLSIAQNAALFSLLGTTYGGDGITTFRLPDLRGRTVVGQGPGPGLTSRTLGEMTGSETVTLIQNQIPAHTHTLNAAGTAASQGSPTNALLPTSDSPAYAASGAATSLSPTAIGATGGNQPHENMQPMLVLNYIIALQGIYPSRN